MTDLFLQGDLLGYPAETYKPERWYMVLDEGVSIYESLPRRLAVFDFTNNRKVEVYYITVSQWLQADKCKLVRDGKEVSW